MSQVILTFVAPFICSVFSIPRVTVAETLFGVDVAAGNSLKTCHTAAPEANVYACVQVRPLANVLRCDVWMVVRLPGFYVITSCLFFVSDAVFGIVFLQKSRKSLQSKAENATVSGRCLVHDISELLFKHGTATKDVESSEVLWFKHFMHYLYEGFARPSEICFKMQGAA